MDEGQHRAQALAVEIGRGVRSPSRDEAAAKGEAEARERFSDGELEAVPAHGQRCERAFKRLALLRAKGTGIKGGASDERTQIAAREHRILPARDQRGVKDQRPQAAGAPRFPGVERVLR